MYYIMSRTWTSSCVTSGYHITANFRIRGCLLNEIVPMLIYKSCEYKIDVILNIGQRTVLWPISLDANLIAKRVVTGYETWCGHQTFNKLGTSYYKKNAFTVRFPESQFGEDDKFQFELTFEGGRRDVKIVSPLFVVMSKKDELYHEESKPIVSEMKKKTCLRFVKGLVQCNDKEYNVAINRNLSLLGKRISSAIIPTNIDLAIPRVTFRHKKQRLSDQLHCPLSVLPAVQPFGSFWPFDGSVLRNPSILDQFSNIIISL